MKLLRFFSVFLVMMCCLSITPFASAEGNSQTGTGSSNPFMDGLMNILQESIDDFIGNYKGSLGNVKLIERVGNRVVLEVTYDNVKRSDNVHVQGEVLYFGSSLEGFSNTLSSVTGSHGKVKLAIGWSQKEDDGWETAGPEVTSDQIRLFLVRESNPDRPFGEIIYDIAKTWAHSDAPDEAFMVAEDDGIELEEGEITPDEKPQPDVFVKPGTILMPQAKLASPPATAKPLTQPATQAAAQPAAQVTVPLSAAKVGQRAQGVNSYDFYKNAKSAVWRSSVGTLSFPGAGNDPKGFVRIIPKGRLNSGNAANSLLQTHPPVKANGWIGGRFPLMVLGDNLRFKAIVGFLQGANQTDGVRFLVYVRENNKLHRVASSRVSSKKYVTINAGLSKWAGKKVQIELRVSAGNTSTHDWVVWVKPRLSK
jgi:hypothetical protein